MLCVVIAAIPAAIAVYFLMFLPCTSINDCLQVVDETTVMVRPPTRKAASRVRAAKQRERDRIKEKERAMMHGEKGGGAAAAGGGEGKVAVAGEGGSASADEGSADDGAGSDDDQQQAYGEEDDYDDGYGVPIGGSRRRGGDRVTDYVADVVLATSGNGDRDDTYFSLQAMKAALPSVIVQGIPTVNRAVITQGEQPCKDGAWTRVRSNGCVDSRFYSR